MCLLFLKYVQKAGRYIRAHSLYEAPVGAQAEREFGQRVSLLALESDALLLFEGILLGIVKGKNFV